MGVYWDNSTKGGCGGGVYEKEKRHNSWRVEIYVQGKKIRIGRFKNKDDALKEFELAQLKYGIQPKKHKGGV